MKLFAGSASFDLARHVASILRLKLGNIEHHLFPDGEQRVMLKESVVDEDVVIIQSTGMPTDRNYIELFLLLDAATRNGAKSVTAVIPYVGYSRQDHVFRTGEARSLEVMINFIETAGATRMIGFDFHSIKLPELFTIPVTHLSALPLFAATIKQNGWLDNETVLVSPDMGGLRRLGILADMLSGMAMTSVEKNRDLATGSIGASGVHGEVKRRCLIVDDMISSGRTIVQAAEILSQNGAEEIYVFATHPVFSEDAEKILQESVARRVFVTDTIVVSENKRFEKLEILSVADFIAQAL
ncbi:MAG: ribose-phosphate pyrophosphokinase [Candidatus Levybacteria bacterium]|nr:ribose-phosphate pyrophosphokinase [Candidatus Levybacteria bacterium]